MGSIPNRENEIINIFYFLSGKKTKVDLEFGGKLKTDGRLMGT